MPHIANSCVGCHADFADYQVAVDKADLIRQRILDESMPPEQELEDNVRNALLSWAEFSSSIKLILSNQCASCHPTYNEIASVKLNGTEIRAAIEAGTMPPGGPLEEAQSQQISDWFINY